MSKSRNALTSLRHRLDVAGSARVRAFQGSGAPSSRIPLSAGPVTLGVLVLILAVMATPALAFETHVFSSSFSGSGANALSDPQGVAIDQSTGEVYVVDSANDRVEIFSASGTFIKAFGTAGSGNGQFTGPTQIAVDNSGGMPGDVYVLDKGDKRVEVFNSKGEYQSQITEADVTEPTAIAVDAAGNLWVVGGTTMYEFAAGGALPGSERFLIGFGDSLLAIAPNGNLYVGGDTYGPNGGERLGLIQICGCETGVAVDPVDEDVYAANSSFNHSFDSYIAHFVAPISVGTEGTPPSDSFGSTAFGSTGSDALVESAGLAVDGSTDSVYVADAGSDRVDVFVPATLPDVTTEAPTEVTTTTALLHGMVNPVGIEVSSCEFEWGTEPGVYSHTVACSSPPGSGSAEVAVSAELVGLTPNTTYHYRLAATNADGKGTNDDGQEESVLTPGPPTIDAESSADIGSSRVTLNGRTNPDGFETHYHFEYGGTDAYGTSVPIPEGAVAAGFGEQAVSAPVTGLKPNTTYHYRLVASNEAGPPIDGPDQTFTTLAAALVEESVSEITAESATLDAQINPLGTSTTCEFQYVTAARFQSTGYGGAVSLPCPTGLGAGEAGVSTSVNVQGLTAGTVYHYRVIATNALGIIDGLEQTFTTQAAGAFALPDGRQWEMVSPPAKEGALIDGLTGELPYITQAAASGDALTYLTNVPTESEPVGYSNLQQVLATRGPEGWSNRDLSLPHPAAVGQSVGFGQEYRFFSEDLSRAVVQPWAGFVSLSPQATEQTSYLQTDFLNGNVSEPCLPASAHCYQPLATSANDTAHPFVPFGIPNNGYLAGNPIARFNECPPDPFCGPRFQGASPDGEHVVVNSEAPLTSPGPPVGQSGLYEWAGGRLSLVSVLPKGEGELPVEGVLGAVGDYLARGAVSDDGSVIWSRQGTGVDHLYMRNLAKGETVRLDAPEKGVPDPGYLGIYQDASADGSRVWFTESGKLTRNAAEGNNLYECVISENAQGELECQLTDLTPANTAKEPAEVDGIMLGASSEACDVGAEGECDVYFVAGSVLAPGAKPANCATAGDPCNLYVRHDGVTSLVAILSNEDNPDWSRGEQDLTPSAARVSPDGRWLAFMSNRDLTGYDTDDKLTGKPDEELYVYDAQTGKLACASCDPTGARPLGVEPGGGNPTGGVEAIPLAGASETFFDSTPVAALTVGWTSYSLLQSLYQPRFLSDSGRVFFNSLDALVPKDVNGTWDVYQWEPEGVGSCGPGAGSGGVVVKPAHTFSVEGREGEEPAGCVGLISSGRSPQESAFLDASENGEDVFFQTSAQLSPRDFDNAYDIYDAHECTTASPCHPESAFVPAECTTADACRAAPAPQPSIYGPPPSATFNGRGNLSPPPPPAKPLVKKKAAKCPAGKIRNEHGNCVKRRKAKKKPGKTSDERRIK